MYKIYADDMLIYDSTLEDYKIGKGVANLETNKSGSFTFSLYPDHFFYDRFVRLKTVITVYKSGKIVFRGRILNDVTDYRNNKVITCEGELGFFQDSIIRPFSFSGTPKQFFERVIAEHNAQVDEFKRFKIGAISVVDPNNYILRSNSNHESTLSNLTSRLIDSSLGGYFHITHGKNGTDPIPTINYVADFTKVSSQKIEFGSNLKNYTKIVKADDIATVIIPLGHEVEDGSDIAIKPKLTIESVNDGKDYVFSESGVAMYGQIVKVVSWDDVTEASNLKTKAEAYLDDVIKQNVTIELNAIDLHLLDRSIESFNICDYIHVISKPHNFDATLLCKKMTLDLLKPGNDSLVLGYNYSTFTETNSRVTRKIDTVTNNIQTNVNHLTTVVNNTNKITQKLENDYTTVNNELNIVNSDLRSLTKAINQNTRDIADNSTAIQELFVCVSSGKKLIASAITDKGITTSNDASFLTMANNIRNIPKGGGSALETKNKLTNIQSLGLNDHLKSIDGLNVVATLEKYAKEEVNNYDVK